MNSNSFRDKNNGFRGKKCSGFRTRVVAVCGGIDELKGEVVSISISQNWNSSMD